MNDNKATMTQAIEKSWGQILDVTRQIESLAGKEEWATVSKLATDRHLRINKHFAEFPVGPETASFYSQELNNFIVKEEALKNVVKQARKETLREGTIINNRKKLVNSYR